MASRFYPYDHPGGVLVDLSGEFDAQAAEQADAYVWWPVEDGPDVPDMMQVTRDALGMVLALLWDDPEGALVLWRPYEDPVMRGAFLDALDEGSGSGVGDALDEGSGSGVGDALDEGSGSGVGGRSARGSPRTPHRGP